MTFKCGVPSGAPCLDGHFPGNPIVPGAVLLGYAANALRENGLEIAALSRMKFMRPLLPQTPFEIEVSQTARAATLFWRVDGATIAQARVTLRPHGD